MSFFTDVKNAFSIITFGDWRELLLRCKVYLRIIDLKVDNPSAVPTERTYPYSNSGGINLYKVLDTLNISPLDGIIDFGSGKGGALISFSRYP